MQCGFFCSELRASTWRKLEIGLISCVDDPVSCGSRSNSYEIKRASYVSDAK